VLTVAVLGPGGVGGFLAGALSRAGEDVIVVAREDTADRIARDGLVVESTRLGTFTATPRAVPSLGEDVDVLVIATKATTLDDALERVHVDPALVVPLLNGFEHVERLRERFAGTVAGSIRIGAHRPEPGHVVHTSPFAYVEVAGGAQFVHALRSAEVPAKVRDSEAEVLWSKLVRLAPLALSTAAADGPIGAVLAHPHRRVLLEGAVDEAAAVANAEGAPIRASVALGELLELDGIATPPTDALVDAIRDRYPHA
jgi:2-dehydropantoate 2-reductase